MIKSLVFQPISAKIRTGIEKNKGEEDMFLIQKVEELVVTYDDGRKNIGEFILKNMDTIHTYSIQEIATHTYTSKDRKSVV